MFIMDRWLLEAIAGAGCYTRHAHITEGKSRNVIAVDDQVKVYDQGLCIQKVLKNLLKRHSMELLCDTSAVI